MRMVATVSRILRLNSSTIQNTHSPKSNPRMILSTQDTLCQSHSFVSYSHEVYRFGVLVSLSLPTKNAPIPYESSILLCPIYICTKHPSLETRPTKQKCIFGISSSHQLPTASCHRVEASPGSDLPKPLKVHSLQFICLYRLFDAWYLSLCRWLWSMWLNGYFIVHDFIVDWVLGWVHHDHGNNDTDEQQG